MIKPDLLGRYECRIGGHNKFWTIMYDSASRAYQTSSGGIGNAPVYLNRLLPEKEALSKIKGKIKKDYSKVFINKIEVEHQKVYLEERYENDEALNSRATKKFKV